MRSHEVAELAGVTVRTLRHYHQIGILPEPPRQANGYRSYDLATVARLLRIRQLTEIGIPLDQIDEMLDTTPKQQILDAVDHHLSTTIERLQVQRRQIARLRETGARADVPEGLAELLSLSSSGQSVGVLGDLNQDALLLLARLLGPDALNRQAFRDLADAVDPTKHDAGLVDAAQEFDRLTADATTPEIDRVARHLAAVLEPILARLEQSPTGQTLARTAADQWPDPARDSRLNAGQARAMARLAILVSRSLTSTGPSGDS